MFWCRALGPEWRAISLVASALGFAQPRLCYLGSRPMGELGPMAPVGAWSVTGVAKRQKLNVRATQDGSPPKGRPPMTATATDEDRLLNVPEREMIAQTRPPVLYGLTKEEILALAKRLREARDRSSRIASQQQREMRGKAGPRGAAPARDNAGSEAKTEVLVAALTRLTASLRQIKKTEAAQKLRKVLDAKKAATPRHPSSGRTASKGMKAKDGTQRAVRVDPREVGRVSKAVKTAQARRP